MYFSEVKWNILEFDTEREDVNEYMDLQESKGGSNNKELDLTEKTIKKKGRK